MNPTPRRTLLRPLAGMLAVGLAAGALAACGDDDEDEAAKPAKKPTALPLSVNGEGKKAAITIPDTVTPGVVEITFQNNTGARHDAQLVRVEGDHSEAEVLKVVGADEAKTPEWLFAAGGVAALAPHTRGTSTQELEEGTYYVVDTEPDGKAPTAKFEVTGEPAEGELPDAPATITAKEYSFTTSGLKPGVNTVRFENTGKELHHTIALPLKGDATLEDVKKLFSSKGEPEGPPPFDEKKAVGTTVLDAGQAQVTQLKLNAGRYVLACFISDRTGGPPHVAKGMVSEVEVR